MNPLLKKVRSEIEEERKELCDDPAATKEEVAIVNGFASLINQRLDTLELPEHEWGFDCPKCGQDHLG